MKYKMVVCDFDDTLISSDGTGEGISKLTTDTIARYIDAGGIFSVSTGRSMGSLLRQIPQLKLEGRDIPLVSLNGTYAINSLTHEVLRNLNIDFDTALRVCDECEKRGLNYHYYDKEVAYVSSFSGITEQYLAYTKSPAKEVGKISDFVRKNKPECMKLLVIDSLDKIKLADTELPLLFEDLSFLSSSENLIEVISAQSGKGNALKAIADLYKIPMSEVIAIGDSMNDYSMIEAAGLGIAMSNADQRLKEIAGYITDDCKEDGAAKAMMRFCFSDAN